VVEIERPRRGERRRGKSDPIDAHLAALHALRLGADRLPTPRADGDREALRILLDARRELTTAKTRTINRLRALLLTGSDTDRALSRGALTPQRLAAITRRRGGQHETREHAVRRAEARRLALAISGIDRELADNKCQLADLVTHLAPQLLAKRGVGPVSAAQAIVSWSHGALRLAGADRTGSSLLEDLPPPGAAPTRRVATPLPHPAAPRLHLQGRASAGGAAQLHEEGADLAPGREFGHFRVRRSPLKALHRVEKPGQDLDVPAG
jgi:hypothetical protein